MKTGFVTLVGRPNAGKSTLLNQILDRKIAIVSDKAQTTRHRITGVLTNETGQIVFLDTPGIHKPRHKLGERMVEIAQSSLYDADVIYYLVDVNNDFGPGEQYILNQLQKADAPVFLILNKIDRIEKQEVLGLIAQWQSRMEFAEIFPLSARKGDNVEAHGQSKRRQKYRRLSPCRKGRGRGRRSFCGAPGKPRFWKRWHCRRRSHRGSSSFLPDPGPGGGQKSCPHPGSLSWRRFHPWGRRARRRGS